MLSGSRPGHPATSQQTSGTEDYNPVAPSTGVPSEPRRAPGAAARSAIARAAPMAFLPWHTARQNSGSSQTEHPASNHGSPAKDGSPEPGPPATHTKTSRPDRERNPASSAPQNLSKPMNHNISQAARGFSADC